ncbi:MAG: hypothetical protein C0459_06925 [Chitinophaga sp.]|jgi:hypothetical protein|nr:hypothetical protein [Chitinophaga sp.]
MSNNYKATLKQHADILLNTSSSWQDKRNTLHAIAGLFSSMDIYDLQDQSTNAETNEKWLGTGYAVSSWSAAMCLLEVARTTVFLKGIIEAIQKLLEDTKERPINIVDAGCGPYAILSIIPALYFSSNDIQLYLIDIIPENIISIKKTITKLELVNYIGGIYEEDAGQFKWTKNAPMHIAVSETMLNALRKEPQVAITLNLRNQLAPQGIFIPEQISVDLMAVNAQKKQHAKMLLHDNLIREEFETKLANIMELSKNSPAANKENTIPLKEVQLTNAYNPNLHELALYTTIKVFGNNILQHEDCSLTLPFIISRPYKNTIAENALLQFQYRISGKPAIEIAVIA